ncbi:response regulator [Sporosarcina sp. NPDC096371]|uniref:response regulator n=1 Tax=Sporosarcina sp. NPDC096371 TaxID=3364530 RepID=UPI0038127FB6
MRILIAEDEQLERQAMKKFINENFKEMDVVGEAVNGRMAIELARQMRPELIIMDIKMPGINGLEAIEQIYAVQPTIKFIVVSAYNTFEYAKQAMQFGIKDYILKPGKKEEISLALLRIQGEIANDVRAEQEKRQSGQLMKENFIRKLMKQHIQQETFDLQKQLFPHMASGYFFVLNTDISHDLQHIKQVLELHVPHFLIVHEANDSIAVLVLSTEPIKKSDQLTIVRNVQMVIGEHVFIGIGHTSHTLENLPTSYREAYTASFQLKIGNKSNYGFLQEDKQDDQHKDIIAQIAQGVEKGNNDVALLAFKENQHVFKVDDKEKLYILIQNIFAKRNISLAGSSISTLQSNKDWHTYLNVCCMKMNEYCHSKQSMTKAKAYIEAHYSKGITLEDTAAFVNLSPNYFSNLFKEDFGENFIEFLTKTRMENAKILIEENNHSLKEISFMVGYKDPNYFSKVFKKYFRSSPRQFQGAIFEK